MFVAWLCLRFLWVLWHKFPGDVALDLVFDGVVYFGVVDSVFLLLVLCWRFPGVLGLCGVGGHVVWSLEFWFWGFWFLFSGLVVLVSGFVVISVISQVLGFAFFGPLYVGLV